MVYVILVEGFEEIEAVYPIDVLRRCGVQVKTVGMEEFVTGSNGITIKTDMSIDNIEIGNNNIALLLLPGGPGRVNLKKPKPFALIKHCFENDVPIAAICGTPEILGESGLLKGRKVTCYPGLQSKLIGAEYIDQPVVVDGNLITAQGAGCSEAFAFAVAEFLCGKEKADTISEKMICR